MDLARRRQAERAEKIYKIGGLANDMSTSTMNGRCFHLELTARYI